jgi:hypothetical protein
MNWFESKKQKIDILLALIAIVGLALMLVSVL